MQISEVGLGLEQYEESLISREPPREEIKVLKVALDEKPEFLKPVCKQDIV